MSRPRRNPVRGRQPLFVAIIACASGVLAALAGAQPTGGAVVDALLVGLAAAAVTWAGATAPWWLIAVVALIAATVAVGPWLVVLALCAVALASAVGAWRRNLPGVRAVAVALTVQVFARADLDVVFGLSSFVAIVSLGTLFCWGVWRRPRAQRRAVGRVAGVVGLAALVALIGFSLAALRARGPLEDGNRQSRVGLDALNRGDTAAAEKAFARAARSFRKADDALSTVWAQGARLLPVVAQHQTSTTDLSHDAARAMSAAAAAVGQVDPEQLRVVAGRIDLDAVAALEQPFTTLSEAIVDLEVAVDDARSPWLVAPIQDRLDSLTGDLQRNEVRAQNALLAVQVAPRMLGADGVRHYFVAFTTPAEARGLGGFMGNFAELTIDNGFIQMTRFGRHDELSAHGDDGRRVTGLAEFVRHWGRFGFTNGPDGGTGYVPWTNVTMPPDMPMVSQVISQLYPQSSGLPVDGVFVVDPDTIAALMSFTGAIDVEGIDLTAQNAEDYIVEQQYLLPDNQQRIDLLETIARATVDRLLAGSLPPPAELGRTFGPLSATGHLMAWSADPEEQELFRRVGMDGALPALDGADGVAVTIDNAGGNKIDAYLELTVDHVVTYQVGDQRQATVTVTLTNTAPASGLPDYVIGNLVGLPKGTNRSWLSVYTALPMVAATLDGQPTGLQTDEVLGWHVASAFVDVPPGATVTVQLTVQGTLDEVDAPLVTRMPALYVPPVVTTTDATLH